jgi:hypothetical protein
MAFITSEGMLRRLRAACLVLLLPSGDATGTGSLRRAELRGAPGAGNFDNDNPEKQKEADQLTHEVSYWNWQMDESKKVADAAGGALKDAKYVTMFDDADDDDDANFTVDSSFDNDGGGPTAVVSKAAEGAAFPETLRAFTFKDVDTPQTCGEYCLSQGSEFFQFGKQLEVGICGCTKPGVLASQKEDNADFDLYSVKNGNETSTDSNIDAEHRAALHWAAMLPDGGAGNFTALTLAAGQAMHSDDDNVALAAAKALVQAETHVSNNVFEFNSSAVVKLCDEFEKVVQIEEEIWGEMAPMKQKETAAVDAFAELDDDYDDNSMALAEASINFQIKNNTVEYCRLNVQGEEWMIKEDEYEIDIDHQRVVEYKAAAKEQRPHMFDNAAAFREYKAVNNAYKAANKEENGLHATLDKSNSTIADMQSHCDQAEDALAAETSNLRRLERKKRDSVMEQHAQKANLDLIQGQVLRAAIKLWRLKEKREALKTAIENMGEEAMNRCPEAQKDYSDVYTQGVGRSDGAQEAPLPDGVTIPNEEDASFLETEPLRTRWVPGGA